MVTNRELVELYKRLKRIEIRRLVDITRKLQQKYGPQVADDIAEVLTERVHEKWDNMNKGDASLHKLYELMWDKREGIVDKNIEVKKDDELRLRVSKCFYAEEYKKLGAQDLGYKYSCMCEYPAVDVFNPRISFRRFKTLMQDCDYCDHCYKIVKADDEE
jgi:hypothetical protein